MLRLHLCLNFKSMLQLARVARADAALLTVAVWLLQHGAVPAVVHGCSSVIQISLALILFYIIKQFHQINLKWFVFVTQFSTAVASLLLVMLQRVASVANISSYSSCSFSTFDSFCCCSCANWNCTLRLFLIVVAFYLFSFSLFADCSLIDCHCPQTERGSPKLRTAQQPCVASPCCMFTLQHFSFNALAMTLTRRFWRWLKSLLCPTLPLFLYRPLFHSTTSSPC